MEYINEQYQRWLANADVNVMNELKKISGNQDMIEDAFYRDLEFGTGGLRGVIGAGTNRMNIHTVAKASQGVADYVKRYFPPVKQKIAVSYDSRNKSELFAQIAASVFAANEIHTYIYTELLPTPCLSFAVRELKCAAGIMITASHNSSEYNGYKVYGPDGCQATTEITREIQTEIKKLDIFFDIKSMEYNCGLKSKRIQYISQAVFTAFIEAVKKQSLLDANISTDKNIPIVYSPLNGTGLKPVLRVLNESGYTNITVVKEQEQPDGDFPTCPYPNPEMKEAMDLGIKCARKNNAELFLATDPDCDRVGIAVKNSNGDYILLSGNETGILLLDYICFRRKAVGKMPKDPVIVKTIVTTDIAEYIANDYGVRTINVLTGFKYIGEQIGKLEIEGRADSYIFGFEESYGYLSGTYVRDKDAVGGVLLLCEMFVYYKNIGISLIDKMEEIYSKYGFCLNTLHTFKFEGLAGRKRMLEIMNKFRSGIISIGTKGVQQCNDYSVGLEGLPKSDVMKFFLEDNCSLIVRPSGTEPKLKIYIAINANSREEAAASEKMILNSINNFILT